MKPSWLKDHLKEVVIIFMVVTSQSFFIMVAHRNLTPQPQIIMVESNILTGIAGYLIGKSLGKDK